MVRKLYFTKGFSVYGLKWSKISKQERSDLRHESVYLKHKAKLYDTLVTKLLPLCLLGLGLGIVAVSMLLSSSLSIPGVFIGIGVLVVVVIIRLMRGKVRRHFTKLQKECDRQIAEATVDVPRSLIYAATDYVNRVYSHKALPPLNHMALDDYTLWAKSRDEESERVYNWLEAFPEDFYELLMSVGDVGTKIDKMPFDHETAARKRFAKLVEPAFDRIAELHRLEDERKALEEKEAQKQRNLEYIEAKRRQWDEAEAVIEGVTALDRAMNQG